MFSSTAEAMCASLIRLPLFAAMSDEDLDDVARATVKVIEAIGTRPDARDSPLWRSAPDRL